MISSVRFQNMLELLFKWQVYIHEKFFFAFWEICYEKYDSQIILIRGIISSLRKEKQKQEAEDAFLKQQKVLGAIIHLKNLNGEATRENIKELFDNFATVRYIDYNKGLVEAYVRFTEENKAKEALAKATEATAGVLTLQGATLEARVLEGEEEEEYWRQIVRRLAESRGNRKNGGGGRGGKRGGGRGGFNRNKRSRDDDNGEDGGNDNNGGDDGDNNKKLKTDAE